ncbi:hypothetical protein [Alkalinema sp. FACHB-956]|uniref:hypothetical protein n=1 Tax=Alkalinema sp. FACHB-956 TaxID=2692768 RepID=UPI00168679C6|nr:hypothetical protein [Alkalinema sp. FACHB-956]MBD2329771.1 hypothetical protein [Alkalinema sp. FACHB-956]
MASNKSYLSSPKYGYDFVVATTQASINAGLKEYLDTIDQPTTYLCFLVDDDGNPSEYIDLETLKQRTGGIDPFTIPNKTKYNDPRITTLTQNRFAVGLKLKLGLPSSVPLENLPPIVDLGNAANNVTFNLFASEFEIIQNNPPSGWGGKGSWQVVSQPTDQPWYFSTKVNLVYGDLDKELNTPYFNQHPEQREALKNQLLNLNSGAFSLQQLLFDLDNAALQSIPTIEGIVKGSNADLVLTKYFISYYFNSVRQYGEPVLAVHAVANAPDWSSLRLTGMERQVAQFVDGNGIVVKDPTPEQKQVTTLAYLCAANNNPLPGAASFNWNWVEPADVLNESGAIAINRNTLATYYKTVLLPIVSRSCIKVSCKVELDSDSWISGKVKYSGTLQPGQFPLETKIPDSGNTVLNISYQSDAQDSGKSGATAGELKLSTPYSCSVSFSGNTITIVQNLKVWCYVRWDATENSGNVFDKTITDVYTLSVGQNGSLQVSAPQSTMIDNSQTPERGWFVNAFTGVDDLIKSLQKQITNFVGTQIRDIPAADVQNFVFPGARVFTYKDAQFSEHQDLVSRITYVKPS